MFLPTMDPDGIPQETNLLPMGLTGKLLGGSLSFLEQWRREESEADTGGRGSISFKCVALVS
ncbi:hypothetical protein DC20_17195 [Rufibacter tibetensis]|uniref:Uncharacterized protein n=1 Tax=Rufibacter tibetensis TaxID=512763 RepID=A0A0P0C5B0_9BACT|nr:hypothetical protein DC20_17195 [Rufibacter tibetensis]